MKMLRYVALLALLLVPTAAFADHYADLYVIPVAGHVDGKNGTKWMSDVAIQNFGAAALTVEIFLIESGEFRTDNVFPLPGDNGLVTIPAGGSVLLKDVLKDFNMQSMTLGALLIGAERPFAVTSRSYSMSPSGDTVGQTVLPVRDFVINSVGDTANAGAVAYIPGAIQNSRFRTNFGFAAGAGTDTMSVEVTVKNAAGAPVGKRLFAVPGGTFTQVQVPLDSFVSGTADIAGLEVRILTGDGALAPYISVIDNVTADAVYVAGTLPPNTPFAKTTGSNTFRRLFDRMTQ